MQRDHITLALSAMLALGCGGAGDGGTTGHGGWQKVTQGVAPNLPLSDVFVAGKDDVWITTHGGLAFYEDVEGFRPS